MEKLREHLPVLEVTAATADQLRTVVAARLLVAQAGGSDACRWWADQSLAEAGQFVLRRLFPRSHDRAGRRLALLAATARYDAAAPGDQAVRHLFFLGDALEAALDDVDLDTAEIPQQAPHSPETLRSHLVRLSGEQLPEYVVVKRLAEGAMEISLPDLADRAPHERPDLVALGLGLAACEGQPGAPVFPYLRLADPEPTWR